VQRPGGAPIVRHGYGYEGLRTSTRGSAAAGSQVWFSAAHSLVRRGGTAERWHYVSVGNRVVARLTFPDAVATPSAAGLVATTFRRLEPLSPALCQGAFAALALLLLLGALRRRVRPLWQPATATLTGLAFLLAIAGCGGIQSTRRALEVTDKRVYFHQGLGAGPALLSNASGAITDERRFEPFGQPIDADLTKAPLNGLNKETDLDTGWSYHGARWMAPQTARWLTPDPPVKAPDPGLLSDLAALHPYQYASAAPTFYWDPDGRRGAQIRPRLQVWTPPQLVPEPLHNPRQGIENARRTKKPGAGADSSVLPAPRPKHATVRAEGEPAPVASAEEAGITPVYQLHHIATHYGDWGVSFQRMFASVGMGLDDPANLVMVPGHHGGHPFEYHRQVNFELRRVLGQFDLADQDERTKARTAFKATLGRLAAELSRPGSALNQMVRRPASGGTPSGPDTTSTFRGSVLKANPPGHLHHKEE
jgi:RHS repeat-associated protein